MLDAVGTPLILGNLSEDDRTLIEQFFDNAVLGGLF